MFIANRSPAGLHSQSRTQTTDLQPREERSHVSTERASENKDGSGSQQNRNRRGRGRRSRSSGGGGSGSGSGGGGGGGGGNRGNRGGGEAKRDYLPSDAELAEEEASLDAQTDDDAEMIVVRELKAQTMAQLAEQANSMEIENAGEHVLFQYTYERQKSLRKGRISGAGRTPALSARSGKHRD